MTGRVPRRRAAWLWLAGVLVAAAVVAALLRFGGRAADVPTDEGTDPPPAATQPGPRETPSPDGPAGPAPPVERTLAEALVRAAGRYVSNDLAPVPAQEAGAAPNAYQGTFSDGLHSVVLRAWALDSPSAAAAAGATPPEGFTEADLSESGSLGDPVVGAYSLYESGAAAALRWTDGSFLLELSGAPAQVRELYLAYPL